MSALNIRESGRRAFLVGIKASENPFHIGSQARSWWAKGWRQARDGQTNAMGKRRTSLPICGCCSEAPAAWHNPYLLGTDIALCQECFTGWYEQGLTDPDAVAAFARSTRSGASP